MQLIEREQGRSNGRSGDQSKSLTPMDKEASLVGNLRSMILYILFFCHQNSNIAEVRPGACGTELNDCGNKHTASQKYHHMSIV
jgi:hypothetical protein